jgi:KDO2-lipid IV(A) lauroyltransferase
MRELYPAPPWRFGDPASRLALYRWWVRDPLEGLRFMLPDLALRALPTDLASDIGARLARGQAAKRPGPSARVRALMRRLRPEATAAEIEAMVDAHWTQLGRTLGEFPRLHRLWGEGRIEVTGAQHPQAALAAGRPLLVAGLHLGNWEAVHAALTGLGIRFHCIYQRLNNRFRMRLAHAARNRTRTDGGPGVPLAPTRGAALFAQRLLDRRESALLLYVDEYWEGRVHAPAFGRGLRIEGNIARAVRLASATGAALVPAYAERIGDAARFRVTFLPPVDIGPPGRGRAGIRDDIAALDAAIEPAVRAHPEQWLMAHVFDPET